jgi:hypothetical protein
MVKARRKTRVAMPQRLYSRPDVVVGVSEIVRRPNANPRASTVIQTEAGLLPVPLHSPITTPGGYESIT